MAEYSLTPDKLLDPTALPAGYSLVSHRRTPSNSDGSTAAGVAGGASASAGEGGHHNIFHHTTVAGGSKHSVHSSNSSVSSRSVDSDQKRQQHRLVVTNGSGEIHGTDRPSQQPLAQTTTTTTTDTTTTDGSSSNNDNNNQNPAPSSSSHHHHSHNHRSSKSHRAKRQTLLTKALLTYLNFFRVVQPLASLTAFGTITPVLSYFRTQTIFPTIQATLYLFTATLACCSLFFSIVYLIDVLYHKPLFWPFTHRHFRPTSKARIGGDLIICMVFSGLWFLSGVGLVIDTAWVDCGRLIGLESVFEENHRKVDKIRMVCQLEKATLGLAVISWACWMGVLLVLLYGHFWKRRQVIAERLRDRLSRRGPTTASTEGTSSAVATHPASSDNAAGGVGATTPSGTSVISGRGIGGSGGRAAGKNSSNTNSNSNSDRLQLPQGGGSRQHEPSGELDCQDLEGEVGLTGIICRYDDEEGGSTIGQGSRRSRPQASS
ncbi:hypothetical protein BGZ95_005787 [Linnemannia exigua]|uniref:MARVEL domain-containing protein n=1 Tax=Linnemannia exigua TaxID=604196 RepID=A0AAD4D387_9FUNG|nr:hypothetical protein BGZ95_005787 [Linnemannia exigua]